MLKIAGSNQAGSEISFNSITVVMMTLAITVNTERYGYSYIMVTA